MWAWDQLYKLPGATLYVQRNLVGIGSKVKVICGPMEILFILII